MFRMPRFLCLFACLLMVQVNESQCFSWRSLFTSSGIVLMRNYWSDWLSSHGYDTDSQREQARRAGSCAIPFPAFVQNEVPIAPETVPQLLQQRIAKLQQKKYDWPVCKPILLTGCAGTGKSQLPRYMAQQAHLPFLNVPAAGLMSATSNSGVANVAALFKSARVRPESYNWSLRLRALYAWLARRPVPRKEPTVVFIDEFDAISKRSVAAIGTGDNLLEGECRKTYARLLWEISFNPYNHNQMSINSCPPANTAEQVSCAWGVWLGLTGYPRTATFGKSDMKVDEILATCKNRLPRSWKDLLRRFGAWEDVLWKFLCGQPKSETLVIAATNHRADELDPSVREWFDVIEMKPYDLAQRLAILKFHARNKQLADADILPAIALHSEGYSGDRIASILNDAALIVASRPGNTVIQRADINQALTERHLPPIFT